jgi:hypothetical protein
MSKRRRLKGIVTIIKKTPKYRLNGSHLFLTYSKVDVKREVVLEQLKIKLRPRLIEKYVLSTEEHQDGSKHVHVYLGLDKRCDITDARRLDINVEGGEAHGNYQSCRSFKNVIDYVVKEGVSEVLTNMDLAYEKMQRP